MRSPVRFGFLRAVMAEIPKTRATGARYIAGEMQCRDLREKKNSSLHEPGGFPLANRIARWFLLTVVGLRNSTGAPDAQPTQVQRKESCVRSPGRPPISNVYDGNVLTNIEHTSVYTWVNLVQINAHI